MSARHGRARSPRGILLFALASAASGLGCKKKGPDSYVYSVFVEESPSVKAESLEIDGKAIALTKQYPRGKSFSVTFPAAEYLSEKKASVVVGTSCGPTKLDGKLTVGITKADTRASEDYARKNLNKGANDFTASFVPAAPPQLADVYVDFDGATGAAVTVGTIAVDPKSKAERVPLGTCPTAGEVKVGGASVGTITVKPGNLPGKPDVAGIAFVDAKGGHCYEKKTHVYVEKDVNTENMALSTPERLEGKRVYVVDLDDFLTPSPTTLTTKDDFPSRVEIRRCDLAPAKGGAPTKGGATKKRKK
jgi:hypothetical protein